MSDNKMVHGSRPSGHVKLTPSNMKLNRGNLAHSCALVLAAAFLVGGCDEDAADVGDLGDEELLLEDRELESVVVEDESSEGLELSSSEYEESCVDDQVPTEDVEDVSSALTEEPPPATEAYSPPPEGCDLSHGMAYAINEIVTQSCDGGGFRNCTQTTGYYCCGGHYYDYPIFWCTGCSANPGTPPFFSPIDYNQCDPNYTGDCNDGHRTPGEQCDDGNSDSGDGCSSSCNVELDWDCPENQYDATSECAPLSCGNGGRDHEAEGCDDGNEVSGDGCSSTCDVESGYICEPGLGGDNCHRCGNGVLDPGEECDDGDFESGDGCSGCHIDQDFGCDLTLDPTPCERCGNGVRALLETCDDGNTNPGDGCSASCSVESDWTCEERLPLADFCHQCGNGVHEPGNPNLSERCDDFNRSNGDGCTAYCQSEPGWFCDSTVEPTFCFTECGDGIRAGTEECDDGNTIDGDGCNGCVVVPPTPPTPVCGNGIKEPGEECDLGEGNGGGFGCSAICQEEPGWDCTVDKQGVQECFINVECGDGVWIPILEGCDTEGDTLGCINCLEQPNYRCDGVPEGLSECVPSYCGDGVRDEEEVCDDADPIGDTTNDGCVGCFYELNWHCVQDDDNNHVACYLCGDGIRQGQEECDDGGAPGGCDVFCNL